MHPAWVERARNSGTGTDGANRHRALIAYLSSNNLTSTAAALRAEIGLGEDVFDATTAKKYEGLLEKKWTSVVRLQKKVGNTSSSLRCTRFFSTLRPSFLPSYRS